MNTSNPPYHPGYGVDPPLLAGRDELIAEALGALRAALDEGRELAA